MFAFAAGLAAGIAALHALPDLPPPVVPAIACALAAMSAALRAIRGIAIGAALGFTLAWCQASGRLAHDWPCSRDRELVTLAGVVAAPASARPGRIDFDLLVDADDLHRQGVPPRVRLAWYDAPAMPLPGERWQVPAHLRCRRSLRNPGGFDRELALVADGIGATGYVSRREAARRLAVAGWRRPVEQARAWLAARVAAATQPSPSTGILQGLAVGVRGNVSDQQWQALAATSTAHLIAISGLHVTAFAFVALGLFRAVLRVWQPRGLSERRILVESLLVGAAAGGYTLLAGAALPALRTCAMLLLALVLRAWRRDPGQGRLLAMAAALLLALDPLALLQAGFWLSFVATAALLAVVWTGRAPAGAVGRFASAQAAVSLALVPVSAIVFGGISCIAPLANALAIPFFSLLLLPLTLAGIGLAPFWERGSAALLGGAAALLDRCWPALHWLASVPLAMWYPPGPPHWLAALALTAAFVGLRIPVAGLRAAGAALVAALLLRGAPAPGPGAVAVTMLDVGQGLAVVVRTAGHAMLFDTGPRWRGGGSAGESVVLPYLRHEGIRELDLLVLSHADADHTGGSDAIEGSLPVARVLQGAGDFGGRHVAARCIRGDAWDWDGVRFEVLHPAPGASWSDNDGSCVLLVRSAGGRLLLTADVQAPAEAPLAGVASRADVVLVPHHGSATSSTPAFVAAVRPRWALVSAGYGNRWGMPRPEVVARWRASGATVLGTHESGALQFEMTPADGLHGPEAFRSLHRRWWHVRTTPAASAAPGGPGRV